MRRRTFGPAVLVLATALLLPMTEALPTAARGADAGRATYETVAAGPTSPRPASSSDASLESRCPAARSSVLRTTPATHRRTVALTFDDGPTKHTEQIVDILDRHRVKATFFVTGKAVDARPEMVRAVAEAGMMIGNHTYSHPQAVRGSQVYGRFDSLAARVQAAEIDRTTKAIVAATGTRPCVFRAPGGWDRTATTMRVSRSRGMSVVNWSVSSGDSGQPARTTPNAVRWIVANATRSPGHHPIVLMHDGKASPEPERLVTSNRSNTVAALPAIIKYYTSRGYVFTDTLGRRL